MVEVGGVVEPEDDNGDVVMAIVEAGGEIITVGIVTVEEVGVEVKVEVGGEGV